VLVGGGGWMRRFQQHQHRTLFSGGRGLLLSLSLFFPVVNGRRVEQLDRGPFLVAGQQATQTPKITQDGSGQVGRGKETKQAMRVRGWNQDWMMMKSD